jgi:hypothetical protein
MGKHSQEKRSKTVHHRSQYRTKLAVNKMYDFPTSATKTSMDVTELNTRFSNNF